MEDKAEDILHEMAHTMQLPVIRWFGFFLVKVMKKLYTEIKVNERNLEKVMTLSVVNFVLYCFTWGRCVQEEYFYPSDWMRYLCSTPHIREGLEFSMPSKIYTIRIFNVILPSVDFFNAVF